MVARLLQLGLPLYPLRRPATPPRPSDVAPAALGVGPVCVACAFPSHLLWFRRPSATTAGGVCSLEAQCAPPQLPSRGPSEARARPGAGSRRPAAPALAREARVDASLFGSPQSSAQVGGLVTHPGSGHGTGPCPPGVVLMKGIPMPAAGLEVECGVTTPALEA